MTLFLRNARNESVVEIEIIFTDDKKELRSSVAIAPYSNLLIDNLDAKDEVISDFSNISELRSWFWETYIAMDKNPSKKGCIEKVKAILNKLATKYELFYIED